MRNEKVTTFEDLIVWQKAHKLMLDAYEFARLLPNEEKYNRIPQLKRAASSIPANIAEGYGRYHYQENIQFCRQARGSSAETINHIIAARDLKQAPEAECVKLLTQYVEGKLLPNGYIRSTRERKISDTS